jgi:alkylation response protein AidB-like acyl-CoA dehydrogenase
MTMTDQQLVERVDALVTENRDVVGDRAAFRGAQFDAGLALVHFPEGHGGLGLTRDRQAVVDDALRAHGVRYEDLRVNPIGIGMGAPTVLTYGNDELKAKHLRRIFTGEDIWCQMFVDHGCR